MAQQTIDPTKSFSFTNNGAETSNGEKCESNFDELYTATAAASAGLAAVKRQAITIALSEWELDARFGYGRMPVEGPVVGIHWGAHSNAVAAGVVTGEVEGGGNRLDNGAIDLKTGINEQLKSHELTATTANLTLAAGSLIRVVADGSVSGPASGAEGLTCIVTYDVALD